MRCNLQYIPKGLTEKITNMHLFVVHINIRIIEINQTGGSELLIQ